MKGKPYKKPFIKKATTFASLRRNKHKFVQKVAKLDFYCLGMPGLGWARLGLAGLG